MKSEINEITGYLAAGLIDNQFMLARMLKTALIDGNAKQAGESIAEALKIGAMITHQETIAEINDLKVLARFAPMRRDQNNFDEQARRLDHQLFNKTAGARLFGLDKKLKQALKNG